MPLNCNWLMDKLHEEVEVAVIAKGKSRTINAKGFEEIFNTERKEITDWSNKGLGLPTYSPATKQAVEQRHDN